MTDDNCKEKVNFFSNQNDISENGIPVESRRELNPVGHMSLPKDDVPISEANTELIYVDKQMNLPDVDIPVHAEFELVPGDQHMNPPEVDIPFDSGSEFVYRDQHMNPPEVDILVDSGSEFVSGEQRMNFPDYCISVEVNRLEPMYQQINVHDTETQNIISVDEPNSLDEIEGVFSQGEQNSESMYLDVGPEDIGEEEVMFHDMNDERGTLFDSRVLVAENWSIEEETRDQPMNFHHTETQNIILVDESDQPSLLGEIEAHLQGELNSELMQLYVSLLIEDMREEEVMFEDLDEEMDRDMNAEFWSSMELDCPLTTPEV